MSETNSLVVIDPKEFGVEETTAAQIAAQFQPMLDKMTELEKEYNTVVGMPVDSIDAAMKARELRLKYVKVRTGTDTIHKSQKAFYLAGGRYVDGWKSAQLFASQGKEEKLLQIEKHVENLEKARIASVQSMREEVLSAYEVANVTSLNLGTMSDEIWNNFLSGTKMNYEARIKAERMAAEERKAQEIAEAEERERVRIENERLKAEAAEREAVLAKERAAAEAEKKRLEDENKKQREAAEKEAARIKKENDAAEAKRKAEAQKLLDTAREETERIAKELREKQEAEAAKAAEDEARAEAELSKGDAQKFSDLVQSLEKLPMGLSFKSKKHKKLYADLCADINALVNKTIAKL